LGKTPAILKSGIHKREYYDEMFASIIATGSWQGEIWNRNKKGELYAEFINISSVKGKDGEIENFIAIFSDITSMKEHQEKLAYLVNFDPLTGLANRRYLHDRLEHALQLAKRNDDYIAIIFIDLDNFKYVNDTLGHEVGDKLLVQITERLKGVIRESDTLARMGGDEFVLLAEKIEDEDAVAFLAQKIVESLSDSFLMAHNKIFTGASVGISLFPIDGTDIDTLMKKADMAMYQSKEQGKGRFSFFSTELEKKLKNKLGIETELRQAIAQNEFVLYYQPQVDSRSGQIVGLEALIRWNHPQRGIVSPLEFIPTAEDDGLIIPIGDWVIMKALSTLRAWQDAGVGPGWLAINIADKQFREPTFVSKIASAIEFFKVDPTTIKIELTEGIIMDKPDEAIAKLDRLKELGVKISIDDFGTGYSSLSYLRRLPIDQFKIDRSFVKDIGESHSDEEITAAMIAMGQALNIEIIAEGVETKAQLEFLSGKGCFFIQGFYYSKPKPQNEITAIMVGGGKMEQE
jgi:diguanylate cyclase (GGDEF)-like protein